MITLIWGVKKIRFCSIDIFSRSHIKHAAKPVLEPTAARVRGTALLCTAEPPSCPCEAPPASAVEGKHDMFLIRAFIQQPAASLTSLGVDYALLSLAPLQVTVGLFPNLSLEKLFPRYLRHLTLCLSSNACLRITVRVNK